MTLENFYQKTEGRMLYTIRKVIMKKTYVAKVLEDHFTRDIEFLKLEVAIQMVACFEPLTTIVVGMFKADDLWTLDTLEQCC